MVVDTHLKLSDLKAFDLAAAGHQGVLSDESGSLIIKPCTQKEVNFYQESILNHKGFSKYMPTFFGTLQLGHTVPGGPSDTTTTEGGSSDTNPPKPNDRNVSIVLSNLTHGFNKPCVLDLKLGAQLWDEAASLEKRQRLDAVANSTTSGSLGFRVAGMKVYKGSSSEEVKIDHTKVTEDGYVVYDKLYGKTLTAENVIDGLREYLSAPLGEANKSQVTKKFLKDILEVRKLLENQESRMFAASLLFVYEGEKGAFEEALGYEARKLKSGNKVDEDEEEEEEEEEEEDDEEEEEEEVGQDKEKGQGSKGGKKVCDLKLIDFAHATWTPGLGPDRNSLAGVLNVERLFGRLVEEFGNDVDKEE